MSERFLRTTEVVRMLGVTRQTVHRWVKDGYFPPSRQMGPNGGSVAWLESEVLDFIRSRAIAVGPDNADAAGS